MRFQPSKVHITLVLFFIATTSLILGCSKDSDILLDSVIEENSVSSVEERETENVSETTEQSTEEVENPIEEAATTNIESRTTSFSPSDDAHVQSGKGYNQNIVRLEEGHRTSYLMFDLGPIASVEGTISKATLQITINSDDGNGNISVHKGTSNNWSEENLSDSTAPEAGVLIGEVIKEYKIGATELIELDVTDMQAEISTLVLNHENGNDLAFASKEHASKIGPKLVITYNVPEGADEISIDEETTTEETTTEETTTEETTNEEPIAVADATPTSGGAPLEVNFIGSNSTDDSEIESLTWDFKDGSTATSTNPSHIFTEVGEYKVELIVKDEQGLSSTDTVTITVTEEENEGPNAVVSATPLSGDAPLEVTFKGSDSTDDNSISSYDWDFKDGSTSSNANPKHTFDEAGKYEVELTVKDENGLSSKKTITINVNESENEAPIAITSAQPDSGDAPLEVQFTGSDSTDDLKVASYFWDFKDGSTSSNKNPSYSFTNAGTYEVELTVYDDEGLSNKKTITITVNEQENDEAPIAFVSATPESGTAPLEVQFTGSNSTDDDEVVSYSWNFKDGSSSSNKNPSHTFENPGNYSVKLTVSDKSGQTHSKNITISVDENVSTPPSGNYPSNAVFASTFGYKSSNATEAFQAAIRSGNSYVVIDKQSSDWVIEPSKFFDLKNMTIVFEPGVVLRAKSGAFSSSGDVLFHLSRADNVIIEGEGATFKMIKSEYNSGENRHALALNQCDDITIRGLTIKDSGGDGIYISGGATRNYSKNITIEDVICDNNRRQGMSIISAENVWVKDSEFTGSSGADPESGVDLEPNEPDERLVNINFDDCKFADNDSHGFLLSPGHLTASSRSISVTLKDCEFSNNMRSPSSGVSKAEILLGQGVHNNPVQGEVRFERVKFNGSKYSIFKSKKSAEAYDVIFKDCSAFNVASNGSNAVIYLEALSAENTLGGFTFDNFYIEYKKNEPFLSINAPNTSGFKFKNVIGDFDIKGTYNVPVEYSGGYNQNSNSNVSIQYDYSEL